MYDHCTCIFDTLIRNSDLKTTLREARDLSMESQDTCHLWKSNLAQPLYPHSIYFPKFTTWCTSHYSPLDKAIVSSNGSKILQNPTRMFCIPNFLAMPTIDEISMIISYQSLILDDKKQFL